MKNLQGVTYSDGSAAVNYTYDRLGRPDTTTTGTFARLVRTYEPSNLSLKTETTTYDTNGSGTFDAPDFTRTLTWQYDHAREWLHADSKWLQCPGGDGSVCV